MKIAISGGGGGNSYSTNFARSLKMFGRVDCLPKYRKVIQFCIVVMVGGYDVVMVNWIENFILDHQGKISIFRKFFVVFLLGWLRFFVRKVVFVRHNYYPHNTSPREIAKVRDFIEGYIVAKSDLTICHGDLDCGGGFFIPHPPYKSAVEQDDSLLEDLNLEYDGYYLVFGAISRYKKIEDVVQVMRPSETLLVVGSVSDESYFEELQEQVRGKKVLFYPKFISEEQVVSLLGCSKVVIINHVGSSCVVSGAFIHALSFSSRIFIKADSSSLHALSGYIRSGVSAFESQDGLRRALDSGDDILTSVVKAPDWLEDGFLSSRLALMFKELGV